MHILVTISSSKLERGGGALLATLPISCSFLFSVYLWRGDDIKKSQLFTRPMPICRTAVGALLATGLLDKFAPFGVLSN